MLNYMKSAAAVAVLITLGGCSAYLQSSSGTDYLARYDRLGYDAAPAAGGQDAADVDADVRRIASVEPRLEFPARIGLARVGRFGLTAIPGDEALIWLCGLRTAALRCRREARFVSRLIWFRWSVVRVL